MYLIYTALSDRRFLSFCYGLEVRRQGLRKRALISGLRSLLS